MKKYIFNRYKIINVILCVVVLVVLVYMSENYSKWFNETNDIDYIYRYYDGIYDPLFTGGKWFLGILSALLFVPSHIFKKWLIFIAPIFLIVTINIVRGISVYSGNLLNPTRDKMAENCMVVLGAVTIIFVASHLLYDWKKKK